eukprot:TRINITY_DN90888_c0_g1_i1.p1 TRINITY_DN90888_c0_g1~~TRINITY_DN90888_c0_g1_i1.p1  ORF type:complete len:577 (+),score=79.83 TRINITY_DN90888_c0_g1_i1:105-1835(+)
MYVHHIMERGSYNESEDVGLPCGDLEIPWDDSIVTVMVRQLPRQLNRETLVEEIHKRGFEGLYDFLYLPCGARKRNVGYGFISFLDPLIARRFRDCLSGTYIGNDRANEHKKPLRVHAAVVQGAEQNFLHFIRGKAGQQLQDEALPLYLPRTQTQFSNMSAGFQVAQATDVLAQSNHLDNMAGCDSFVRGLIQWHDGIEGDATRLGKEPSRSRKISDSPAPPPKVEDEGQAWGIDVVTVMVRCVPRSYTQQMFFEDICKQGFKDYCDFLYLPYDAKKAHNIGYGFVSFTAPEYALAFRDVFDGRVIHAKGEGVAKPLRVHPACIQGYEENVNHFAGADLQFGPIFMPSAQKQLLQQPQGFLCTDPGPGRQTSPASTAASSTTGRSLASSERLRKSNAAKWLNGDDSDEDFGDCSLGEGAISRLGSEFVEALTEYTRIHHITKPERLAKACESFLNALDDPAMPSSQLMSAFMDVNCMKQIQKSLQNLQLVLCNLRQNLPQGYDASEASSVVSVLTQVAQVVQKVEMHLDLLGGRTGRSSVCATAWNEPARVKVCMNRRDLNSMPALWSHASPVVRS